MKELVKIYQDRGNQFIEDLFNDYVVITEKLSGSSFSFQKDGKHLSFYKGDNQRPINLIDRTLMIYYEPPIKYISSLPREVLETVPDNWRFSFQYFVHNSPSVIEYDTLPKNSLVLTHIIVKDERGKNARIIEDPRVIKDWGKKLGVTPMQPIFKGHLTPEQKEKLIQFIEIPVEDQMELFGTNSFVEYMVKSLNPSINSTLLNTDLSKPIDSIVFKFYKPGSTQTYSAKMVDPYTRSLMKEKEPIDLRRAPADINEIVLLDILAFLEERGLKKHEVLSNTPEEKYLELVSGLFNDYVDKRGDDLAKLDFQKADFAKAKEFDLNTGLIRNEKTKKLIEGSDALKDLFKVMLGSLRKKRNPQKEGPLFTQTVIMDFNNMVDKIKGITQEEGDGKFKTFEDYLNLKNINEELYLKEDLLDLMFEERHLNFSDFVNLEKFAIHEALRVPHKNQGKKKVNMFAGRFQPFTTGHLKVLEDLHKQNGLPVMVMIVRGKKTDPKRTPFDEDAQQRMIAALQSQYPFIEGSVVVPNGAIDTMFSSLRPTYEPVLWGYGTDRKKSYDGQIQHDSYRAQLGVLPEFQGHEIKRGDEDVSASKVRNALERDDRKGYEKLVPRSLHDFYDELQNIMVPIEEGLILEMNKYQKEWANKFNIWSDGQPFVKSVGSNNTDEVLRTNWGKDDGEAQEKIEKFLNDLGISSSDYVITQREKGFKGTNKKPISSKFTTYELEFNPKTTALLQRFGKDGGIIYISNTAKGSVAGCPPWGGSTDLNPAWWGVTGEQYTGDGLIIALLGCNQQSLTQNNSYWKKMLVGDDTMDGLAKIVLNHKPSGGSFTTMQDLVDAGNTDIVYDVSSLFGKGAPYQSFPQGCKTALKTVQNGYGEILGALMLDKMIKRDEHIFFPSSENHPLIDFKYGPLTLFPGETGWGISAKGGKGAAPSTTESFKTADDILNSLYRNWVTGKETGYDLTADEIQFMHNIIKPYMEGKNISAFNAYKNISAINPTHMTVWKYVKDANNGADLTPEVIRDWLRRLAFGTTSPTETQVDNANGDKWKKAILDIIEMSGTKAKPIDGYWTTYKDNVNNNQLSAEISPVMYPLQVQLVKWLNASFGETLSTLFQKILAVQQIHTWAIKLKGGQLIFQFRPFAQNDFEFVAKGNMGSYTSGTLSFSMAGVKL